MLNRNEFTVALSVFILFLLVSCKTGSKDEVLIKGRFSGVAQTKLLLFEILPDSNHIADSATTDSEGNFAFSFTPKESGFYFIHLNAKNYITLAVNKGEIIELEGDGKNLGDTYMVKGSKESKILMEFNRMAAKNQTKVDSLSLVFKESQSLKEFPAIKKELDSIFFMIFEAHRTQVKSFLQQHTSSLASLLILNRSFGQIPVITIDNDFQLFYAIDSSLVLNYPDNKLFISFHEEVERYKAQLAEVNKRKEKLKEGSVAPEISLPDAMGKTRTLAFLRGNVTLVYFWASWNSLCRKMNIDLSGMYEEFHPKGFEIYAISLDPDYRSWINAFSSDKANWIQVNDTSGLNSTVAKIYKISSLPTSFLLDRNGKIISINVNAPELKVLLSGKL